ncbi:MAG: pilus assembly protein PilP [Candidatus Pelagibacter sp.]
MNFFKIFFITLILIYSQVSFADQHESVEEQTIEQQPTEQATLTEDDEDDVPLNDPFAGNESGSSISNIPDGEEENEMSLYNFKLVGIISGEENSYISLVDASGEVITLSLSQYLGEIKLVDMRIHEAIFEKNDKSYIIIDFNNQIREANEY